MTKGNFHKVGIKNTISTDLRLDESVDKNVKYYKRKTISFSRKD